MSVVGHNRLEALAADIRIAHDESRTAAEQAAERAIAAGHALLEAKDLVPHGGWSEWLEQNVGFSERTARRYMQLAKSGLKTATVADLGVRAAAEYLAEKRLAEERLAAAQREAERLAEERLEAEQREAERLEEERQIAEFLAEKFIVAEDILGRHGAEYAFHPLSEVFPLMRESEFLRLVASIRDHGLHQPIHLYEGQILDGRLRYLACLEAGVEPRFEEYVEDDPRGFLISMNVMRQSFEPQKLRRLLRVFQSLMA